jgi:Histone methylation protein DOT1
MSIETALLSLIAELEQDSSVHDPRHLRQRFEALDALDAHLSGTQSMATRLHHRARAIHAELESINLGIYEAIRRDIQQGGGAASLLEWMPGEESAANLATREGYDYLDELLSGVLQLEEPSPEAVSLEPEMVPYQPTPARHIFDLVRRAALTERDVLIDLGAGLGHVTLMVSICTSASCTGIELEPSYVDCARKSARSLNLSNARFIPGDARAEDLSHGTVFYLYTPFTGAILRDVLNALRRESAKRKIRIFTFGPCTRALTEEPWLCAMEAMDTNRISIFRPR